MAPGWTATVCPWSKMFSLQSIVSWAWTISSQLCTWNNKSTFICICCFLHHWSTWSRWSKDTVTLTLAHIVQLQWSADWSYISCNPPPVLLSPLSPAARCGRGAVYCRRSSRQSQRPCSWRWEWSSCLQTPWTQWRHAAGELEDTDDTWRNVNITPLRVTWFMTPTRCYDNLSSTLLVSGLCQHWRLVTAGPLSLCHFGTGVVVGQGQFLPCQTGKTMFLWAGYCTQAHCHVGTGKDQTAI